MPVSPLRPGLAAMGLALALSLPTSPPALVADDAAEAVRHRRQHRDDDRRERRRHRHREPAPGPVAPPVAPSVVPPVERTEGCPAGMLRVTASFCPEARQACLEMADDERERCLRFRKPTRCRSRRTQAMDFCIDRFEWPNREGATPTVVVSWTEAAAHCASAGRRLCHEDEWTLACEGAEMLPYPWGYERDAAACNIDRHNLAYERDAVTGDDRDRARDEATRVSQAVPSGSMARCVSPFGVRDMTGNVDEWAVSRTGLPFRSVLKGGYWGRVRTRCRPATRRHDEGFRYYQIGFRCCADPAATAAAR